MSKVRLIDKYNRHLNYLRISITDRCNLKCIYCVPPNLIPKMKHEDILSYEEILRLVKIGVDLGITKVRVTGGEPLVRKGVFHFLSQLTEIKGLKDVSLTTNGVLLKKNIDKIKSAGIHRINISLDTLERAKFKQITGYDNFNDVWKAIVTAEELGFSPIKINIVALNEINDDELIDFAKLSFYHPFHIRFIEHMPIGNSRVKIDQPLLTPEIKFRLSRLGRLIPLTNQKNDGPAERYRFEGAKGEVGFISALSRHFCNKCNRLRLTAGGQLRACLLSDLETDLKGPLREGCPDSKLVDIFLQAVKQKPSDHNLALRASNAVKGQMSAIGG